MGKSNHIKSFLSFLSGLLSAVSLPHLFGEKPRRKPARKLTLDKGFESDKENFSKDLNAIYSDFSIAREQILKDAS